jgi:transposase
MFIRKKPNKSGVVSIQIIDKSSGKYKVYQTVGSSSDPDEIESLTLKAKQRIKEISGQQDLNFDIQKEQELIDLFFTGLQKIELVGPELVLGKIFDDIGFNKIKDELFRHLVITRLCYPASKLKTTEYLYRHKGLLIDVEKVYRYLDKLHQKQANLVQQISYQHTLKVLNHSIQIVFYDVTTLYFEIEDSDDLRKTGFSKEGKHQHPQILLGLLISLEGYPLAYDIFEGNYYEGKTMLPIVEMFKEKYKLEKLVVVADSGLLSKENIEQLQIKGYEYILGARIKNEKRAIQEQILAFPLENGKSAEIKKTDNERLIISYSEKRAKKDAYNRIRGIAKLEKAIQSGKLSKQNINQRGYNKFLKLEGEVLVKIDYEKEKTDAKWDGLKGYITNTHLTKEEIIDQYGQLWKIERAFRISKTDLRIRPIYHRLRKRIEAHICIAFCAYKIYKELERILKQEHLPYSPEKAMDIAKSIYKVTILKPYSKAQESRIHLTDPEQSELLKVFK